MKSTLKPTAKAAAKDAALVSIHLLKLCAIMAFLIVPLAHLAHADRSDSRSWQTPAQVLLIRHANRPAHGGDLSPEGYSRANALVNLFTSDTRFTEFGAPVGIFAMASEGSDDSDASSRRPLETVTPLAQALQAGHAPLVFETQFTRAEISEAANEVLHRSEFNGKNVLICWSRGEIGGFLKVLGANFKVQKWPSDVYGRVYVLRFNPDGSVKDTRCLNELSGDAHDCGA